MLAKQMANRTMAGDRPARVRARATNHLFALEGVHRQSELGRRYEDLARSFCNALGGEQALTVAQRANIRRASELLALAEQWRARALRGEEIDPLALVRIENAASRVEAKLGLGNAQREQKCGPSLAEVVAEIKAKGAASRVPR